MARTNTDTSVETDVKTDVDAPATVRERRPEAASGEMVERDDVDDVIGIAARLDMEAEDQLSLSEVEAVAAELDIDPEHVREATRKLQKDRADERAETVRKAALRRKLVGVAAAVVTAVLLALTALTGVGHSGLNARYAEVEARQAQIVSVMERQERVEKRYEGLKLDKDREAEIIGADNRVRVERRRYDQAAAEYNRYSSGLSGRLARTVFGHPVRVELSNGAGVATVTP